MANQFDMTGTPAAAYEATTITYSELMVLVAVFLGYGADSAKWTESQRAEVDSYVQSGIRQFYYPPAIGGSKDAHTWSFLNPTATIVAVESEPVVSLPNMARVIGDFHYQPEQHIASIPVVSESSIMAARARSDASGSPRRAAVRYAAQTPGRQQQMEVCFYPTPDKDYTLTYQYEAYSGKLTDANPYPLGGKQHTELIVESCLMVAEQRADDTRGLHTENFATLLASAIQHDKKQGTQYYGPMSGDERSLGEARACLSNYPITYKGLTW